MRRSQATVSTKTYASMTGFNLSFLLREWDLFPPKSIVF